MDCRIKLRRPIDLKKNLLLSFFFTYLFNVRATVIMCSDIGATVEKGFLHHSYHK